MPSDSPFDGGFRIVGRIGEAIRSLEDWRMFGEPAGGAGQWAEGRSALEEGRAWVSLGPLLGLLQSHAATRGFAPALVRPEVPLELDDSRGRTRHSDVLACGHAAGGKTLVAVEAKADERFDERTLADAVGGAPPGSHIPERVNALCRRMFGSDLDHLPEPVRGLRYQLVHGPTGVALEAQRLGAEVAVFAVHEFVPPGPTTARTRLTRASRPTASFSRSSFASRSSP